MMTECVKNEPVRYANNTNNKAAIQAHQKRKCRRKKHHILPLILAIVVFGLGSMIGKTGVGMLFQMLHKDATALSGETINGTFYDKDSSAFQLILVNRSHPIPDSYEMSLTTLKNGDQVDTRIVDDLQEMFDHARSEGLHPYINSAYRSNAEQIQEMQDKIAAYENEGYPASLAKKAAAKTVSAPGTSEHELGLALDIISEDGFDNNQAIYDWLAANACQYGFILRYPEGKEDITGIDYEPWHYRYVGKTAAKEMTEQGLTLEEYTGERRSK